MSDRVAVVFIFERICRLVLILVVFSSVSFVDYDLIFTVTDLMLVFYTS